MVFAEVEHFVHIVDHLKATMLLTVFVDHEEEIPHISIVIVIIKNTIGFITITTRSTRLLHISLQALGDRMVYNKAYILLIDAYPKSNCGNYELNLIRHPGFLYFKSILFFSSSMVIVTNDSVLLQLLSHFFAIFFCLAVDYARFTQVFALLTQHTCDFLY